VTFYVDKAVLDQFTTFHEFVDRVNRLAGVTRSLLHGEEVAPEERRWVETFIYEHLSDSVFLSLHFTQAVRMREAARAEGSIHWFCAAHFLLTHDFSQVIDMVDWEAWQGQAADTRDKKAVVILVACWGRIPKEDLKRALSGITMKPQSLIGLCLKEGLVQERSGYYWLGPKAPRIPRGR
jgi:hypothetical protein